MFTLKDLKRLIIPLIIEQCLSVLIGMADTVMVSGFGDAAVSGVALVDTINNLLTQLFAAIATGGAIVASQYLGRKEDANARKAASQLIIGCLLLSLSIMTFALVFREPLLHLIYGNVEEAVMTNSMKYFLFTAMSYPFLALYNSGAALFRAQGNSKISMTNSIMMNIINLVGNFFLINPQFAGLGVQGAAIATLGSRFIGSIVILVQLKNQSNRIFVESYLHLGFKPKLLKMILSIGIPTGIENSVFQLGKLLVQSIVSSLGTASISANSMAMQIVGFAQIPSSAIGIAMIAIIGQCCGAKEYKQAKYYLRKLLFASYVAMWLLSIILIVDNTVGSRAFLSIYAGASQDARDIGVVLIMCHSIFSLFVWPLSFTIPAGLRAANDAKFTMSVSMISMGVFRIGLSYILVKPELLGITLPFAIDPPILGVWIAMCVDWCFRGLCFLIRMISGKWMDRELITKID